MPAHRESLAEFAAALDGGPLPGGMCTSGETTRRFDVYRNNVAVSLGRALATRFPVIARLVGDAFFAALARRFTRAHPPHTPVLHEWGAEFPAFLETFAPLAAYPYLGDVARIELARGAAFHAADAPPIAPETLATAAPERLVLGLAPSVHLLALHHPAVSIWDRHQPGGEARALGTGPETALILRDRAFEVPVRAISPADAALIAALGRGEPLARAAARAAQLAPGHDPTPCLVALMRAGALTAPESHREGGPR